LKTSSLVEGARDHERGVDFSHVSVLVEPIIAALAAVPDGWLVDATLGGGGHAEAVLRSCSHLRVLGIDRDPAALTAAGARLAEYGSRFESVHGSFGAMNEICVDRGVAKVSAVIADLGVSSYQFERSERGFSFQRSGPLDMRMNPSAGLTLDERLSRVTVEDLADVLYHYGDIRASMRTANAVLRAWRDGVRTTTGLAERVARVMRRHGGGRIHPATRVFQALRIWVNDEADELEALLEAGPNLLSDGGAARRSMRIDAHAAPNCDGSGASRPPSGPSRLQGDERSKRGGRG
jgi:16S rRNA (cytosine1402-N4)-methyltransferase